MALRDWNRGDVITADHLQEGVAENRRLGDIVGAGVGQVLQKAAPYRYQRLIGTVIDHGPNMEADYDSGDPRYWIQPNYLSGTAGPDDTVTLGDAKPLDPVTTGDELGSTIITVINTREIGLVGQLLQTGETVEYFALGDGQDPEVIHYFMSEGGRTGTFRVALSTDGGTDGDASTAPSYTYTVTLPGGGDPIATAASPIMGRPTGTASAASVGFGDYASGSFTLIYAHEIPGSGSCPP